MSSNGLREGSVKVGTNHTLEVDILSALTDVPEIRSAVSDLPSVSFLAHILQQFVYREISCVSGPSRYVILTLLEATDWPRVAIMLLDRETSRISQLPPPAIQALQAVPTSFAALHA